MKLLVVNALAFAYITLTAYSQAGDHRLSLGITASYNRSLHEFSKYQCSRYFNEEVYYNRTANGTGNGYSLGLTTELPVFSGQWAISIISRIAYESLPAHNEDYSDNYPRLIRHIGLENDTTYSLLIYGSRYIDDIRYNVLSVDLLFRLNLFKSHFGIIAGPKFSYCAYNHYLNRYQLVWPENVQFSTSEWDSVGCNLQPLRYEDNNRTKVLSDGSVPFVNRLGLMLGIQYEFVYPRFKVVPFISYNAGLTNIIKDWNFYALQAGLDARILL